METMINAKIIETREKGYDETYWRVVCESGVIEGEYITLAGAEQDCSEWGYTYEIISKQGEKR